MQLTKRGVAALDNGILRCDDHEVMDAIAQEITPACIDALLRKWLARLPHPFTAQDRIHGVRYDISVLQAEFALTCVFDRPVQGRVFFEEVIRENVGRPDHVQLIFDRRVTRRTPSRCRVITEGVTPSLHVDYKHSRQYHKEGRALRTETVVNDTYDFGIGRRLCNLDALKQIGFAANRRLLCVQRMTAFLERISSINSIGPPLWTIAVSPPYASENLAFRHCCPFCWLFVCFPQALPTDNYENTQRRVCPPPFIHLTERHMIYGDCGCEG